MSAFAGVGWCAKLETMALRSCVLPYESAFHQGRDSLLAERLPKAPVAILQSACPHLVATVNFIFASIHEQTPFSMNLCVWNSHVGEELELRFAVRERLPA